MRRIYVLLVGIACVLPLEKSHGQAGKKAPSAPATVEKSTSIAGESTVKGKEVAFDGDLRLTFKGSALQSGILDACTSTDAAFAVSDRLRATLTAKGNDLSGSGTTDIGKVPFTITLKRTGNTDTIGLTGQIGVGGVSIDIKAEDLDLQAYEPDSDTPEETHSGVVSTFNTVLIKAPVGSIRAVLDQLRADGAAVGPGALVPSCADMRKGYTDLEATVNPARAAGLIAKLNAIGNVKASINEFIEPSMTVKLGDTQSPAAEPDVVAAVANAVVAVTGGRLVGQPAMNALTGEYSVDVQRETGITKRLGLAEQLTTKFLIGKADADKTRYVNLSSTTAKLVDAGASKKLTLSDDGGGSDSGDGQTGTNTGHLDGLIVERVARDLKGQVWDGTGGWK